MQRFTVFNDVPVIIQDRHGVKHYGDLPCGTYNEITRRWEAVDNRRGYAYALRNAIRYRKN